MLWFYFKNIDKVPKEVIRSLLQINTLNRNVLKMSANQKFNLKKILTFFFSLKHAFAQ